MRRFVILTVALAPTWGCADAPAASTDGTTSDTSGTTSTTSTSTGPDTVDDTGTTDTETEPEIESAIITHQFPAATLQPFEESLPCISWTLDNEQPLYVQGVTLTNNGGFHHSNGFVVPQDVFPGPDGVWDCEERGFNTIEAATTGTVLFAQSTQSWVEEQRFGDGAVIKIPAGYKVVSELHLLNITAHELDATLRMSLEVIHPRHVQTVLTPFEIQYTDLALPPMQESRVTAHCDDLITKASPGGEPFSIHWILPHYHYLGNYFRFEVIGGAHDGEVLHEVAGFDASPIGKRLDPPIDLSDAQGIRMTCGYDNWTDQSIGWGNGDGEMCIAFGFAEADVLSQAGASAGRIVGVDGGITQFEGGCLSVTAQKPDEQGPPSPEEIDGALYLPPVDPADQDLPPVPECVDTPADATPLEAPTLSNLRTHVFPSCGFSSCHGAGGQAAGLDLDAEVIDLHGALLGHAVLGNTDLPLVAPGDPEGSWLYHKLSRCEPLDRNGTPVSHMPINAPFLLEPALVAMVRDWIAAGAAND